MPGVKISALTNATALVAADEVPVAQSGVTKAATMSVVRQYVGAGLTNATPAGVSGAFSSDTYLDHSGITIPTAGGWRVGTMYHCAFDMTKTAAGTAAIQIIVRFGTLGTTGDAALTTTTFGAGTAAIDAGWFTVDVLFRAVGAGSGNVACVVACAHNLAATGLISTGTAGYGVIPQAVGSLTTTTQTIIGVSFNGGASFSGTAQIIEAYALNI